LKIAKIGAGLGLGLRFSRLPGIIIKGGYNLPGIIIKGGYNLPGIISWTDQTRP